MSLTVVAECLAAPGYEDRLRTALEAMIEPSMEEPGCLSYRPYADLNQLGRMVIVEEWTDADALAAHFATAHFAHVEQVLSFVLAEPMTVRKLVAACVVGSPPHPGGEPTACVLVGLPPPRNMRRCAYLGKLMFSYSETSTRP
ncbi:putative quinol monooxygenase [Nocardia camponoti]|uniref:ABM domain-containing protein n=1 Tax=Nocardia camponoti TaxID=1616106 RepID=A0A917V423_9NOCA|nr:putative quinol monooxygenase [Nocardia camponoti]GGK36734.1 hypothetical protein GCM10011591_05490 [Nocardia camponoti]